MAAPAYGRRGYTGGAAETTLAADILSGATSLTVADGSTYPTAAFFIDIDANTAGAEKIYVATRTGNTFSTLSRGADGSTGLAHTTGAKIRHVHVAQDADEANAMSAVMTTKGDIITRAAAAGPVRVAATPDLGYLRANAAVANGVEFSLDPIPKTIVDVKGDLIVATAADTVGRLAAAANGQYLRTNSGAGTGLEYSTDPLEVTDFNVKGDLIAATANDASALVALGTQGKVLTVDTAQSTGLKYDYAVTVLTTAQRNALAGSDLWRGRTIFNTDTGALEVYYGATTLWQPPWNVAWGSKGIAGSTSTAAFPVAGSFADVSGAAVTFTALANRNYVVTFRVNWVATGASVVAIRCVDGGGTPLTGSAVHRNTTTTDNEVSIFAVSYSAGSQTIKGQVGLTGGGTDTLENADYSAYLIVEDAGPGGNAPAS